MNNETIESIEPVIVARLSDTSSEFGTLVIIGLNITVRYAKHIVIVKIIAIVDAAFCMF